MKHSRGPDGKPVGCAHDNHLFDTHEYEVEFTDGTCEKDQANVIAKNMFAHVDNEGRQYALLKVIIDHCKDNTAVPISEGMVQSANGTERPKITTCRWELLACFKDGSFDWVKLKDIKESNIIKVAEYAFANHIVKEPAFKCWVPQVLHWWNHIISKVKSHYWCMTHS